MVSPLRTPVLLLVLALGGCRGCSCNDGCAVGRTSTAAGARTPEPGFASATELWEDLDASSDGCDGAPVNACGGCEDLAEQPDSACYDVCGPGVFECTGQNETRCNACL
jgi:hypothetical protein